MKPVALSLTEFYTAIDDAFRVIVTVCPDCKQPAIFSNPATPHECASIVGMKDYKPGSLKVVREDGSEWTCQPGESLFSTATMIATHYWHTENGKNGHWVPIDDLNKYASD